MSLPICATRLRQTGGAMPALSALLSFQHDKSRSAGFGLLVKGRRGGLYLAIRPSVQVGDSWVALEHVLHNRF